MPARDLYHDTVVTAMKADGWNITDDPFLLPYGDQDLYVDLGAERGAVAAEKEEQKIAVEIKSFVHRSVVYDLELAVGQYNIYRSVLAVTEPDRLLYLAVPERVYEGLFAGRFGQLILTSQQLRLLVFDEQQERILKWIN